MESLLGTDCCWLYVYFCKVYRPTPFNMHFDFRPLLRGTFAKISYSKTPAISRGRIEGKANTRGLDVWLSQSLTFGNLAAAFGACFLGLQKASLGSDSSRCKDALQDHGVWLSRSLTFGNWAATYEGQDDCPHTGNWTRTKPKFSGALLLPDPGRQWVAALYI